MHHRRWIWVVLACLIVLGSGAPAWSQDQSVNLDELQKKLDAKKAAAAKAASERKSRPTKKAAATSDKGGIAAPSAGRVFHDRLNSGGNGPEMVVIPSGRFMMGSPSYEGGRDTDEGPQHEVSVKRFAIGKYPVTKAEYAAFVNATGFQTDAEKNTSVDGKHSTPGCFAWQDANMGWKAGTSWRDPGFPQDDSHPATCLSWNDAVAYAEWLRATTGKSYRLPSEAESEYTTRAGSADRYPWGADADQACQYGNVGDTETTANCSGVFGFTSPVGSFKANAFGLYDTIGNVWKWIQDCGPDSYANTPTDGSANVSNGCDFRVRRGGSSNTIPACLRSACRSRNQPARRYNDTGLRVAQDL